MPQALIAKIAALTALCFACLWLGYEWRDREAEAEIAHLTKQHAEARSNQLTQLSRVEADYRKQEAANQKQLTETLNDAHEKLTQAQLDAADARTAADRLRVRVAALLAARSAVTPASPAFACAGPAAFDSGDLLADMFSRLDATAGELGEYADKARIAGESCQRAYDTVSSP